MSKIKNVDAYCTFCNSITKMEVAGETAEGEESSKRWAKCKKCKQKVVIDIGALPKDLKPSINHLKSDESITYSPLKTFTIGESIYHEKWNDFGVVLGKETTSDGKSSILVEFQNQGKKKLLETKKH